MDRLDILLKGNQIDDQIYKILRSLEKNELAEYDEDKKWRFITHMSMALSRIKNDSFVESLDLSIIKQLKENHNYQKANLLSNKWFKEFPKKIPEDEKWFVIMHIIDYLEGEKWK